MDPNKHMVESSRMAMAAYVIVFILALLTIGVSVYLIVTNPQETLKIVLIIIGCIAIVGILVILLKVFVGIYYGAKGSVTQTDMSYSIDDQEHAESFDEAKDAPSVKK